MITHDTYIISLLQKYISNQCTEQELRFLLEWLKSSEDYSCFDSIGEPLWKDINRKAEVPNEIRIQELQMEVTDLLNRIKPQHSTPVTVSIHPSKKAGWYAVAAVAILVMCMTFSLFYFSQKDPVPVTYTEKVVSKGERKVYLLSDGSKVTLNSGSKLLIPTDFNKRNRSIQLIGEGFFEVARNSEKPFFIKSNGSQVKVLGTSFNVKSYEEDETFSVTVSTGKVQVKVASQDLQLSLLPNEHFTVNKKDGSINKETITENNYIKWMNGILYFHKTPIQEVIKTINRTYNKKVILDCKNCDQIITGTHDNRNLDAVIDAICFTTGLKSRQDGNNIVIYE